MVVVRKNYEDAGEIVDVLLEHHNDGVPSSIATEDEFQQVLETVLEIGRKFGASYPPVQKFLALCRPHVAEAARTIAVSVASLAEIPLYMDEHMDEIVYNPDDPEIVDFKETHAHLFESGGMLGGFITNYSFTPYDIPIHEDFVDDGDKETSTVYDFIDSDICTAARPKNAIARWYFSKMIASIVFDVRTEPRDLGRFHEVVSGGATRRVRDLRLLRYTRMLMQDDTRALLRFFQTPAEEAVVHMRFDFQGDVRTPEMLSGMDDEKREMPVVETTSDIPEMRVYLVNYKGELVQYVGGRDDVARRT